MIAFNLLMFTALFATLDAAKLKNPKSTESFLQESDAAAASWQGWQLQRACYTTNPDTQTWSNNGQHTSKASCLAFCEGFGNHDTWGGCCFWRKGQSKCGWLNEYYTADVVDTNNNMHTNLISRTLDPVDCIGSWGAFGSCNATCGPSIKSQTFSISTAAAYGGTECDTTDGYTSSADCVTDACPVEEEEGAPPAEEEVAPPEAESPDGGASGDPHFRGFDGSQYDFQGSPGAVFNLITDEAFQLNARFVMSSADGKTYMGAIGLTVGSNNILVTPDIVVVNDASIAEGNHVYLHNEEGSDHLGFIVYDHGKVRVKTEPFQLDIRIVEQEGFMYLDLDAVAVSDHLVHPHGILGQTAQYMVDGSKPRPVHLSHQNLDARGFLAGTPEDYVVADGLFGTRFPFNHFGKGASLTKTQDVRRFGFGRAGGERV